MEENFEKLNWIKDLTFEDVLNIVGQENISLLSLSEDLNNKISEQDSQKLIMTLKTTLLEMFSLKRKSDVQSAIKSGNLKEEIKIFLEAKSPYEQSQVTKKEKDISPEDVDRINKEMRNLGLLNEQITPPSDDFGNIEDLFS